MTIVKAQAHDRERRWFLRAAVSTAAGIALSGCATKDAAHGGGGSREKGESKEEEEKREGEEGEVTPGEDLMQEHGVLERILLVYDEAARRMEQNQPLDLRVVTSAAGIVHRFVEDYHERLEEQFVFPRLETARREVELVAVLKRQHQRGREVTDDIVRLAGGRDLPRLAQVIRAFERMYRPHAAREDTVLFPAFRQVMGRQGYGELGEAFEEEEHRRFGEHGFEDTVAEVARLETTLGIADLSRFTP